MPPAAHRTLALAAALALTPAASAADANLAFFEQKVRPVLVRECYSCHSAETKKGPKAGLLLDTKAGLLQGGDSGPAVVPGKPLESLLVKALTGDEAAVMPPKGKLPDDVIADLTKWVKTGAPDPRDGAAAVKQGVNLEEGRKHWSFQPVRRSPPPAVADAAWPRTDVDRFVLARLEAKGLKPNRDADRRTLLRRVTIDLTGLPPTPAEIDAFVADESADAYEKVVDRLLASPAYGERWGRHWLDVARYADSNGKDENLTFHEAFRYRDYVVRSFNADKPFDRFVKEQVAGDLLPAADQRERDELLTASGFVVLGPKVLADRDTEKRRMDVVDEQIETVGRAFLGLTLGCARCHDHKFDPVPTADYYALAGIFSSTRTLDSFKLGNPIVSGWMVRALGSGGDKQLAAAKDHQKRVTDLEKMVKKAKADLDGAKDKSTMRVPAALVGVTVDDADAAVVGKWKPSQFSKPYVGSGYLSDDKAGKGEKAVTFTPDLPHAGEYEVQVSYTPGPNRAANVPLTVRHAGGEAKVLLDQTKPVTADGLFRPVGRFRFAAGKAGSVTLSNAGTEGYVLADAVRFVPQGAAEADKEMAMGVPAAVRKAVEDAQDRLKKLEEQEKALKAAAPPAPALVMAPRDEEKCRDCRINVRGNPHQLGDAVPRGVLSVASKNPRPAIPAGQSGRVELADWLAAGDNPLTARVFVNRVWLHLFGHGLVRTADNFGRQGEAPTHPELLDELAAGFVADGWSVKRLVRRVALSRAYRLSSEANAELAKADPENRLLGRATRRRVEAEVIRDAILAASGQLDPTPGGSPVEGMGERVVSNESKGGANPDKVFKRSVYLPVIRTELPQVFEVFDFADPDVSTARRDVTTVPTQALYLMNSPFVLGQARATAERLLALPGDDAGRLADLYRRALGREPAADEVSAALGFLTDYRKTLTAGPKAGPDAEAWTAVALAVFGCTEFRFVE